MHRINPFFMLVAAAIFAISCDRGDLTPTSLDVGASALLGESETDTALDSTDSASEEPAVIGAAVEPAVAGSGEDPVEYPPIPPLDVVWTDGAATSPAGTLSFEVTNTSETEKTFSVALVADGLIGGAIRPIGEGVLTPGETSQYEVAADDLPIRSHAAVSTLSVRITRTVQMPEGPQERSQDLAKRFFRHEVGYEAVQAFDEATLREENGGLLVSSPLTAEASLESTATEVIGEIWNGAAFTEKSMEDSALFLRDDDGNVVGVIGEMMLGSAPTPKAPALEISPTVSEGEEAVHE